MGKSFDSSWKAHDRKPPKLNADVRHAGLFKVHPYGAPRGGYIGLKNDFVSISTVYAKIVG